MHARDEGAAGSILLAFILGAVSGAAVALLYAPASGRETREYLGERAREGRERAADGRRRDAAGAQPGTRNADDAIERGREAYQQAGAGDRVSVWREYLPRRHRRRDAGHGDRADRRARRRRSAGAPRRPPGRSDRARGEAAVRAISMRSAATPRAPRRWRPRRSSAPIVCLPISPGGSSMD